MTAPSGAAVSGAEVVWDVAAPPVRTDATGGFRLPHAAAPREIVIRHPLFTQRKVPIVAAGETLHIVLEPAPVYSESVLVMDRRLTEDAVPQGTAATSARPGRPPRSAGDGP